MTSGQEQVRHSQGLQDSQCSGGPALFVLSGSVPQLLTVISPSPAGTKGEHRKEAPPGNVTAPLWAASAAFGTNCRIQLTAQIEVFLFGKGNGGKEEGRERATSPTETATGGPNSRSQFLRIQTPCWHREVSFYRLGWGVVTLLASVSSPPRTLKGNSMGLRKRGKRVKLKFFSRLRARAPSWALAGWSQAVAEATALPPSSIPQPGVSLSLSSSG